MKSLKYLIGATLALAMFGMAGGANAGVVNSKHDLTSTSTGATVKLTDATAPNTDQTCAFCHTPHAASADADPLWNRDVPTGPYTLYTANTAIATVQPTGVSLACLSCHDGTIALDALENSPGSGDVAGNATLGMSFVATTTKAGNLMNDGVTNVTQDLSNDHPIAFVYDETKTGLNLKSVLTAADVPLYNSGTTVECASCHDVHNTVPANVPFLRVSNASSGLCTTCHIK